MRDGLCRRGPWCLDVDPVRASQRRHATRHNSASTTNRTTGYAVRAPVPVMPALVRQDKCVPVHRLAARTPLARDAHRHSFSSAVPLLAAERSNNGTHGRRRLDRRAAARPLSTSTVCARRFVEVDELFQRRDRRVHQTLRVTPAMAAGSTDRPAQLFPRASGAPGSATASRRFISCGTQHRSKSGVRYCRLS